MADIVPKNRDKPERSVQDQVIVAEAIFNMAMKFILMVVGVVAFFMVLNHFLSTKEPIEKAITGVFDGWLGFSIFKVYNYYFTGSADKGKSQDALPVAKNKVIK